MAVGILLPEVFCCPTMHNICNMFIIEPFTPDDIILNNLFLRDIVSMAAEPMPSLALLRILFISISSVIPASVSIVFSYSACIFCFVSMLDTQSDIPIENPCSENHL